MRRGGRAIPVVPPAPRRQLPPPSVATHHTTTPRGIPVSSSLCLLLVVASRSCLNALPALSMRAERCPRNYLGGHRRWGASRRGAPTQFAGRSSGRGGVVSAACCDGKLSLVV